MAPGKAARQPGRSPTQPCDDLAIAGGTLNQVGVDQGGLRIGLRLRTDARSPAGAYGRDVATREAPSAAPERLSAEDLAILSLESDVVAGHTLKVAILNPSPTGRRPDVEGVRARIDARIDRAPQLRRKLQVRSRRRGYWVDDTTFDLRDHVRSWPATGSVSAVELRRICARLMEERLDRARPLWTIDLIDPLEQGRVALVWRLHHSMADGAVAMRLAEAVLWDAPDRARADGAGAEPLAPFAHLREALDARRPARLPGTLRRELRRTANRSPFDGVVGSRRAVAFASMRLGALRHAVKTLVPSATVNDAVLAIVAGGLRSWAKEHGDRLASLRVKIPVSLQQRAESPAAANRDSFFCVALPLGELDAVERLRRITEETTLRKRARDPLVVDTLSRDVARLAPPLRHLLDRLTLHPHAFALNVSNVIGPVHRPSVLGAPVHSLHSIADVDARHGLRVAAISVADELCFGLCADPVIVGNLDPLVDGILSENAALAARSRTASDHAREG
jgi:WS/DGAT/MGAT family acyltransferase